MIDVKHNTKFIGAHNAASHLLEVYGFEQKTTENWFSTFFISNVLFSAYGIVGCVDSIKEIPNLSKEQIRLADQLKKGGQALIGKCEFMGTVGQAQNILSTLKEVDDLSKGQAELVNLLEKGGRDLMDSFDFKKELELMYWKFKDIYNDSGKLLVSLDNDTDVSLSVHPLDETKH